MCVLVYLYASLVCVFKHTCTYVICAAYVFICLCVCVYKCLLRVHVHKHADGLFYTTDIAVPNRREFELDRQDSSLNLHHITKNPLKSWRYPGVKYSHYLPKLFLLLVIFTGGTYYILEERSRRNDALNWLQVENERLVLENEDLHDKVSTLLHFHVSRMDV